MTGRIPIAFAALLALSAAANPSRADTFVWIDEKGVTHVTDDPASVPRAAREKLIPEGAQRASLWSDGFRGPPVRTPQGGSSADEDRIYRLLQGAVDDLGRGDTARASSELEAVLRVAPGNAEAHWYLALLDRQRGRHESAEGHLRAFLASAGDSLAPWRASAERRLKAIEDEKRLTEADSASGPLRLVALESPNFRIHYDAQLGTAAPDYAQTVVRYLEEARAHALEELGVVPREPTSVILYGKAAYLEAHRHRFSFPTVGFFDGQMHVVSAAHPAGELRALLFHEYTHAVFREQAGSDRPFWLNEGLAELAGRESRRQLGLSRSEREALRRRIDAGAWLALRRLAPGFAGLDDEQARAAYLESTAAVLWIEARTTPQERARLLAELGTGMPDDEVLRTVVGRDTEGIDAAVRSAILAEFPSTAGPSAPLSGGAGQMP
ncbi:MAG TPA: hypothetical protein DEP35_17010 [Deltaproteobacteria bacterium]|nr:hypothetical protein [Deltaproteobacteria bacterium]